MNIVSAQCMTQKDYYSVMIFCSLPSTEKSAVLIYTLLIFNITVPPGGFIVHAKEECTKL